MAQPRSPYPPHSSSPRRAPPLERDLIKSEDEDDANDTTAVIPYNPPIMHRFVNGESVLLSYALSNSYRGPFCLWAEDSTKIRVPGYNNPCHILGLGCRQFTYSDYVIFCDRFSHTKLKLCGGHLTPSHKPIKKVDVIKHKPESVDEDSFMSFKKDALVHIIAIGAIIHHDVECGSFRRLCKIEKLRVVENKPKKTKQESKVDDTPMIPNPFITTRRSHAIKRVGLPENDIEWLITNKVEFSAMLQRVLVEYPIFRGARKTAAKWAKLLILDPSQTLRKVPGNIAKEMKAEISGAVKPTKAELLTASGIMDDNSMDMNVNVHNPDLNELKKQWMAEVEAKLEAKFLAAYGNKSNDNE